MSCMVQDLDAELISVQTCIGDLVNRYNVLGFLRVVSLLTLVCAFALQFLTWNMYIKVDH